MYVAKDENSAWRVNMTSTTDGLSSLKMNEKQQELFRGHPRTWWHYNGLCDCNITCTGIKEI